MPSPPDHISPDVQLVALALDQICDEYEQNHTIIFESESKRAGQHFATVHRGLNNWSKSQQCMVPGCVQHSIARSHSIPKAMSLRAIEQSGHVLLPVFDQRCGELKVKQVGVADATTFPGFCAIHELLFEKFENKGSIEQEHEVYLQIYRAACRELFRARFVVEQHDWAMTEYCKARDKGFVRLTRERARDLGLENEADLSSFKFEGDRLVDGATERIVPVRELITHLEQRVLPALEQAVFRGDDSEIAVIATSIDVLIPVALAGSGSFRIAEQGAEERRVSLLMNVVPQYTSTLIVMAAPAEEKRHLEAYKARWMSNAISMLSMIESWMVNGTDQWCIKPSVWAKIPTPRAAALLSEIVGSRRNIGEECEASIFDDLRTEFIQASEVKNAGKMTPEYNEFIVSEKRKMT